METALNNKPVIIESNALEIKSKIISIRIEDFEDYKMDKTLLEDLKLQAEKEQKSTWKNSDFKNKVVIQENEKINLESVKEITKNLTKEDQKLLLKDIKKYNSSEMFYRNFPLSVSKPIYSSNGKFAVIGFSRGNNGGEIQLYKLVGEKWELEVGLERWAY